MASMTIEDYGSLLNVQGSIETYEVSAPRASTQNIRRNQAWSVEFDWRTAGLLNFIVAGSWYLEVFLEKMGGGEFNLPGGQSAVPFVSAPHTYTKEVVIGANVVPAGLYKLVASLRHKGPGGVPSRIAGFAEGPLLQFYDAA